MELCKSKNIKPSAVAIDIGLSNSITTKWRNGALPKGEILLKLSDYFNCSTDYLLTGKEKSPSSDLTDKGRELLEMYVQLTEHEQGIIIGEMREMLRQHAEHKNGETA